MKLTFKSSIATLASTLLIAACTSNTTIPTQSSITPAAAHPQAASQQPIQHIILVMQQSRSMVNLFSGFPGTDAPTTGIYNTGERVPLRPISLTDNPQCAAGVSVDTYFRTVFNDGKMNGFNLLDKHNPNCPYTYVLRSQTKSYWQLAKQYTLANHIFASTFYGSFTEQLYLIAGTAHVDGGTAIGTTATPAGCDAPAGTYTIIATSHGINNNGPFPCFTQFPTLANTLDVAHVSWKYYVGSTNPNDSAWNAFSAIKYVNNGPDKNNISSPVTNIFSDLKNGNLPSMSWVVSNLSDSDLPASHSSKGPRWVTSLVQAVQKSQYWQHTAIIVVWDDAGQGNFYDNATPPQTSFISDGLRVPLLIISPYAKHGYVSNTRYDFGSILKFAEQTFNLPSLKAIQILKLDHRQLQSLANIDLFVSLKRPKQVERLL